VPDVSVIIPTYNRRSFLQEAVASCFEENEGIDVEVVIVDDGSTDGTRDWLKNLEDPRIRPVFQKHQGPQQARNAGLRAAEGETIKFLDSDDYLYSGTLSAQWNALEQSGADLCYGPIDIVDKDGDVRDQKPNPVVDDLLGGIATGAVTTYPHVFLYRAEVARREKWRPEVPFHQDTAYALDMGAHDPDLVRTEKAVGVHRIHQGVRITTTEKSKSSIQNIEYKFDLLYYAFLNRQCLNSITQKLKTEVACGLWKEAHKLGPANFNKFENRWDIIEEVHSAYLPPRSNRLLSVLDQLWGPCTTERLINPLRRAKMRVGGGSAAEK
jgi:glycosyltransferase involved in cell wall biosynthesis